MAPQNLTVIFGGNSTITGNATLAFYPDKVSGSATAEDASTIRIETYLKLALALVFFFCLVLTTTFLTMAKSLSYLADAMHYQRIHAVDEEYYYSDEKAGLALFDVGPMESTRPTLKSTGPWSRLCQSAARVLDRVMPWVVAFTGVFVGIAPTVQAPMAMDRVAANERIPSASHGPPTSS